MKKNGGTNQIRELPKISDNQSDEASRCATFMMHVYFLSTLNPDGCYTKLFVRINNLLSDTFSDWSHLKL